MRRLARQCRLPLISFLALLFLASFPLTSTAAPLDPVWTRWLTALKSQGFAVTQGISAIRDCATYISVFGNCLNSNPSSGYYDILPPIDDSYIDPCYNPEHDCSGATPNSFTMLATLPDGSQTSVNQFYRLAETDALVVLVNLPPNAAYFGYQSYVYSRPSNAYSLLNCLPKTTFADPCRTAVLGSVGNSINNVSIMNQAAISLNKGGSVAFITTSNQALYDSLCSMFQKVGGAPSRLFAEPFAQKIIAGSYTATVNPGTDSTADEMSTLVRYALPQSQREANAWQSALTSNIQVFRISNTSVTMTRFASTTVAAKHYTTDETPYKQAVDELSDDLKGWLQSQTPSRVSVATMISTVKISKATGEPSRTLGVDILGPYCLTKGTDCLRDTQDTDSYRVWVLPTSLSRTAAIVGVDSTQTGNATYIGIGITDYTILEGVAAQSQTNPLATGFSSGTLTGSAADIVSDLSAAGLIPAPSPALVAALPSLFVAFATRDCTPGATALICGKSYTTNIDPTEIPLNHGTELTLRTYVHPGDANGPNPDYIFPTQVIY